MLDIAWFDGAFYLPFFKKMYMDVLPACMCLVFTEAETEHQIPLELEFHTVESHQWVLGLGPRSSGRTAGVLN